MEYTEIKMLKAKVIKPYVQEVEFNDGKVKEIDLEPILYGSLFEPLSKPELLNQVRVNKEIQTIEWPNGADFHPETLYNLEGHKSELGKRAKGW